MIHLVKRGQFDFDRLARFALTEPPRVRALLGAMGEEADVDSAILRPLRRSLNPLLHIPDSRSGLGIIPFGRLAHQVSTLDTHPDFDQLIGITRSASKFCPPSSARTIG